MKKYTFIVVVTIIIVLILAICFIINLNHRSGSKISNFELVFLEDDSIGIQKIFSNDVFVYNGKVEVVIDNAKYSLKDALTSNKLTTQDILEKAKKDAISIDGWEDGGSTMYTFNNYRILKYNTLTGNKDLYIGSKGLNYSIGEK